jgi:hypothetical protein
MKGRFSRQIVTAMWDPVIADGPRRLGVGRGPGQRLLQQQSDGVDEGCH